MNKASAYFATLAEHRRRLDRLIEQGGVQRLKRVYDKAQAEVAGKLRSVVGRGLKDTFTAHQHRIVLSQIRFGQAQIAHHVATRLGEASTEARIDTVRGLASDVGRLEKHFTGAEVVLPIEDAAVFQGVVHARDTSLLRQHQVSMQNYGSRLVGSMEDQLTLSLVAGETVGDAIDRVQDVADDEWWQAERIARTELSYAANTAHLDAMGEIVDELPDLESRWTEYVDDDSFEPMDDRVGVDSIAMHGQVAPGGTLFYMPDIAPAPDAKGRTLVSASLRGLGWLTPPNRPNDRAYLAPWRPDWGIPAWRFDGGDRSPA